MGYYESNKQKCKAKMAAYGRRTKDERRAYQRQYRLGHIEQERARSRAWKKANPGKVKAQGAVQYAKRKGDIVSQPCVICGNKAQAHHDSYLPENWLNITWYCHAHHNAWHRLFIAEEPTTQLTEN